MDTHEDALAAAQAAQSAAIDARELLAELLEVERRRVQPARIELQEVNQNTDPVEDIPDVDRAGGVIVATAIINFDAVTPIFVGWAGRAPRQSSQALQIAPRHFVVCPWIVDRVEISVDGAAPPAPGVLVGIVRFKQPQQFMAGVL